MTTDTADSEVKLYRGDAWSIWDSRLVQVAAARAGRVSPNELAALCGGTPAKAAARLREILADRDWMTIVEQRSLVMEEVLRLKTFLWGAIEGGTWIGDNGREYGSSDPRWAAEMRKTLELMDKMISTSMEKFEDDSARVSTSHAQLYGRVLEKSLGDLLTEVKHDHPEIDITHYEEVLRESILPTAVALVEGAEA